ncbi:unnamed protein product [Rotaria sp. Silwood2]|nr:unnamed protein product [Rotaria sp. Silwood2]
MKTLGKLRSRVQPKSEDREYKQSTNILRKRDRNLMKMIFIEVMFYVISTIPFSIYLIYKITTNFSTQNQERKQFESFIGYIVQYFILYINTVLPFYIYVSTSSSFRTELKKVFNKFYTFIMRRQIRNERDDVP